MEEAGVDDNEQMPTVEEGIKLTGSEKNNNTANNSNDNTSNDEDNNNNEIGNGSIVFVQRLIDTNRELLKAVQESARRDRAASIKSTISDLQPMFFDGKDGDPVKLDHWIREFEKIFSLLECPEEMRVNQAVFYLSGNADAWWCNNMERLRKKESHVGENGEEVLVPFTWDDFKRELWDEFFPKHIRKQKWMEFDNLKQGTLSVQDYYFKFIQLARIVPEIVPSTEESQAWKFQQNLDIEIQASLGGEDFATLSAVYERARYIEGFLYERKALIAEKRKGAHFNNSNGFRKKRNFNN